MRAIAADTASKLLREQFIPDHVFVYVAKGGIRFFDGKETHTYTAGSCGLARKNQLVKFTPLQGPEPFEPYLFCFDADFLATFAQKHRPQIKGEAPNGAVVPIRCTPMIDAFIRSIKPYYKSVMELDADFEAVKYEELLIILLKTCPELVPTLFDFGPPQKLDLEAFMNQNYRFNISISQFAQLTGRSLSAFKRDFKAHYQMSPGRWLVQKRLEEAHFLLHEKQQRPSEFYTELGFESLSHFSVAYKKRYGSAPTK